MVSISVHVSKGVGVGAELAPPRERRTDEACASQDAATEDVSQLLSSRSPLGELMAKPDPLARFRQDGG
jgi:hypothetical protein